MAKQSKLLLLGLAEYLQVQLTAEQVVMYAAEFPDPKVLGEAIKLVKNDPEVRPGRFLLPAQIKAYITASAASDGKEVAALIFECIMEYGPGRQHEAKARMGAFAWSVCKRYGGFGNLCQMETRDKATIFAQLRDMAINMATRSRLGLDTPVIEETKQITRQESTAPVSLVDLLKAFPPMKD